MEDGKSDLICILNLRERLLLEKNIAVMYYPYFRLPKIKWTGIQPSPGDRFLNIQEF